MVAIHILHDMREVAVTIGKRRIDLNLLGVFDAVYRARNLTAAGEVFGLSQPAMSHALARLRWMVKDPLFVKTPRGLQPTAFADEIAPTLRQSLDAVRRTLAGVNFDPLSATRVFRIAMTDIGEQILLPRLCAHLGALAPGIAVEACQPTGPDLREAMARGEVDLAYGGTFVQLGAGFRSQLVYRSGYVCLVRRGHPAIRNHLTFKQFRESGHVVAYSATTSTAEVVERALLRRDVSARIAVRVPHCLAIPAIVASTNHIAIVQENLARSFRRSLNLRLFPPPIKLPQFDIRLHWHERADLDPANRWLRATCAKVLTQ
jgi:DNA-binding transcriptional LysR family regulator